MIKNNLSRMMGERRLTVTDLSEKANISRNTISSLYHETSKGITWEVLSRLCAALDCQPSDLLEYIPEDKSTD